MVNKTVNMIKDNVIYILIFSIFLTSSFDIILNLQIQGYNFRITQLLSGILILYYMYELIKTQKVTGVLGIKHLILWSIGIILFTFNTVLPSINFAYNLWLIFDVVLVFSLVNISEKLNFKKVFELYIVSFLCMAIFGILEFVIGVLGIDFKYIMQWWIPGKLPRINGFSYEPSYYATYMLLGWSICRYLVKNKEVIKDFRINIVYTLIILTISIIISSSRMCILLIALYECLNVVVYIFKFIKNKNKISKKYFFIIGSIIIVSIVGFAILIKSVDLSFLLQGTGLTGTSSHSISIRENDLKNAAQVFFDNMFLGTGLGGVYAEIANNVGYDVKKVSPQKVGTGISVFVEVLAASGIIVFIFFVLYIITIIFKPLILSKNLDKKDKFVIKSLVFSLIMELIILQFNQNILRQYLWLHIAMVSMAYNFYFKKRKNIVKVAVDARMINMSGIGTYIQNLMKNGTYNLALGNSEEIKAHNFNGDIIEYDSKIYGLKEQLKFPYLKVASYNPEILHVPHYNVPIFYSGKMVVTIHDLTHLVYPEFLPNKFAYYYAKIMIWIAIKKSYKILTVSENTKKDILKMYKVNPNKIKVIYNGVSDEFCHKSKNEIEYLYEKFNIPKDKKILMYVGNLKPHKNLEFLLEAFSKIKNRDKCVLLLVGKAFAKYNELGNKEKILGIEENIIHTGIVEQDDLINLYNLIDLFVFPSLYEGFGLPILEALKCGARVISSNSSSIPEVGGKFVKYFDPYNVNELVECIETSLTIEENLDGEELKLWLDTFEWKEKTDEFKKVMYELE